MKYCPHCKLHMDQLNYEGVQVDVCRDCGGLWLDAGEGVQTIGPAADPSWWEKSGALTEKSASGIECPAGHGPMEQNVLTHKGNSVSVDVCFQCHGMWLDRGEAAKLNAVVTAAAQDSEHMKEPGFWSFLLQAFSGIPIEVWHPVRRIPWLTIMFMLVMLGVFVYEAVLFFGGGEEQIEPFIRQFGFTPSEALEKPWTILTYGFLHGGVLHILGNLYFFYVFADNIEDRKGRGTFLLIFLGALVAGGAAQFITSPDVPVVGASGAVAGLMGAYFIFFPRVKVYVVLLMMRLKIRVYWYMGIWVGLQFLIALEPRTQVAWMAHLGGFLAGVFLALFLRTGGLDAAVSKHRMSGG